MKLAIAAGCFALCFEAADACAAPQQSDETRAAATAQAALCAAGWDASAAESVARSDAGWFAALATDNPAELTRETKLIASLGKWPQWGGFLIRHPETAGLLAAAEDPVPIMETLKDAGADLPRVLGLYGEHSAPADARALATALQTDRRLICRLLKRGMINAEVGSDQVSVDCLMARL